MTMEQKTPKNDALKEKLEIVEELAKTYKMLERLGLSPMSVEMLDEKGNVTCSLVPNASSNQEKKESLTDIDIRDVETLDTPEQLEKKIQEFENRPWKKDPDLEHPMDF